MNRLKLLVVFAMTFVLALCLSMLCHNVTFAQTPAGGVVVTSTASPAVVGTGIVATILAVLTIFNGAMSVVTQAFAAMHKSEPAWAQKIGTVGLAIMQFLSANTSTPPLSQPGPTPQPGSPPAAA